MRYTVLVGILGWLALTLASPVIAQPFTYQGVLKQNGQPVNGTLSISFKLFTALTGGSQVGSTITQNVNVQNGLFTVQLDFGNVWDGSDRYLEISVGSTPLSPRVKINPAPYAIYAGTAFFAQRPWQTSGSNIFYNSGNVGIGTSSPSVRLSLGGDNANTKLAIWDGGTSGVMGFGVGPSQFRIHLPRPSDRFSFLDAPNGNEIVTIRGSGNVGIGITSPSERLHVNGNIRLADDGSIFGLDQLVGFNDLRLYGDATGGPDVYIAANGNVGIGASNPEYVLDVRTDTNSRAIFARNAADGGIALAALAAATTGRNYGVIGQTNSSSDGIGVVGIAVSTTGQNYGIVGQSNSPSGYAGYFVGRGHFSDRLGVGTETPEALLHVSGGNAFFTNNNTTLQVLPGNLLGQSQANAATLEIPGDGTIGVWDNMTVSGTLRAYGNLHVGGNTFTLGGSTDPNWSRVLARVEGAGSGSYVGVVETLGANGSLNARMTWTSGYPNHGAVGVYDSSGTAKAGIYVNSNGDGVLFTTQKSFREPDPDDPTRDIWYGCIEGPELAMYVRGTARLVNGRARIELPDHFRKLADEQGMTVQLTPRSAESRGLAAVRVSLDGIEVVELLNGRGNYEFDWEVKAVRKDHRDFRVYRPWDEVLTAGEDPAQAWEARLKSIEDRKARQREINR